MSSLLINTGLAEQCNGFGNKKTQHDEIFHMHEPPGSLVTPVVNSTVIIHIFVEDGLCTTHLSINGSQNKNQQIR